MVWRGDLEEEIDLCRHRNRPQEMIGAPQQTGVYRVAAPYGVHISIKPVTSVALWMIPAMPLALTLPKSATSLWCDRSTTNGLIATDCNLRRRFMVQSELVNGDDFFPRQLVGGAPAHDRQHIALLDQRAQPAAEFRHVRTRTRPTLSELQRSSPWVWLWCERCQHHTPFACAVAVNRWGPDAPSDALGLALAAPVAAAKVRHSSIQAGLVIMLASVRFRRMSMTRLTPTPQSSSAAATGLAATTILKTFRP